MVVYVHKEVAFRNLDTDYIEKGTEPNYIDYDPVNFWWDHYFWRRLDWNALLYPLGVTLELNTHSMFARLELETGSSFGDTGGRIQSHWGFFNTLSSTNSISSIACQDQNDLDRHYVLTYSDVGAAINNYASYNMKVSQGYRYDVAHDAVAKTIKGDLYTLPDGILRASKTISTATAGPTHVDCVGAAAAGNATDNGRYVIPHKVLLVHANSGAIYEAPPTAPTILGMEWGRRDYEWTAPR